MKLESPYLRRGVRLEMTALMDVMFLVLVFFVYAVLSMSVHRGLKVELPGARGVHERGERIVITIDAQDALQLDGRPLPRATLVRETARLVRARPGLPVLVSGDRRASLGAGIGLLGELKAAGVEKASFQVSGEPAR